MRQLLLISILLIGSTRMYASHAAGMDISYEYISPAPGMNADIYKVTVKFYRDCGGNTGVYYDGELNFSSSCSSGSTILNQIGGAININPNCPTLCNGGSTIGIEEYTFEGLITLVHCSDWTLSWCESTRNAAINTINLPDDQDLCIQATLNNTGGAINNSPKFSEYPTPFILSLIHI